jgi:hypothetical protein
MKHALMLCLILALCSIPAMAQGSVTFAWDYSPPMPSGFEMRLAPTAGAPATITFDCGPSGSKECTVQNIPAGNWFARVFAYNLGIPITLKAYSDSSNEVALTMPPKPAPAGNLSPRSGQIAMEITVPDDSIMRIALSFDKKPVP